MDIFSNFPYLKKDLGRHLDNQTLIEVFFSSAPDDGDVEEKALILKEKMPGCNFYMDTSFTTDVFKIQSPPFESFNIVKWLSLFYV